VMLNRPGKVIARNFDHDTPRLFPKPRTALPRDLVRPCHPCGRVARLVGLWKRSQNGCGEEDSLVSL
jgi:hypothetical protein